MVNDKEVEDVNVPDGPFGTKRNSASTTFEWAHKVNTSWLQHIEEHCDEPMKTLGYAKLKSSPETSKSIEYSDILVKTAEQVWPHKMNNTNS